MPSLRAMVQMPLKPDTLWYAFICESSLLNSARPVSDGAKASEATNWGLMLRERERASWSISDLMRLSTVFSRQRTVRKTAGI